MSLPVLALRDGGIYLYGLVGQCLVGLVVLAGWLSVPQTLPLPALWITYFVQGHAAGLIGALILLFGLREQAWKLSTSGKAKL